MTSTANSQQIDYSFELFDVISMACKSLDNGKLSFFILQLYYQKLWTSIFPDAKVNSSKITCKRQEKNCAIFLKIYFHGQLDDNSQPVSMWGVAQLFWNK